MWIFFSPASSRPLVLLLEDAHAMDDASARLLGYFLRALGAERGEGTPRPVLVCAARREGAWAPHLDAVLRETWPRSLPLARLDPERLTQLARGFLGEVHGLSADLGPGRPVGRNGSDELIPAPLEAEPDRQSEGRPARFSGRPDPEAGDEGVLQFLETVRGHLGLWIEALPGHEALAGTVHLGLQLRDLYSEDKVSPWQCFPGRQRRYRPACL